MRRDDFNGDADAPEGADRWSSDEIDHEERRVEHEAHVREMQEEAAAESERLARLHSFCCSCRECRDADASAARRQAEWLRKAEGFYARTNQAHFGD